MKSGALDLDGCALDIGWGSAHGCYKATLKLRQRASTVGMSETAGRNGCIRAISRDTRISQNQSGLRRVAAASRAGSGTPCRLGTDAGVSDTGAPELRMSVGGWLTENHHRPVAAPRDISAELSTGTAAGGAPNCSPGRSHNRIGQGGSGSAWGICQHNSAPQRPLICDTPTPLIVRKELLRPGRESTSRACTRRLGREVDSPMLSTEWPEPRLHDEGASGRAA